MPRSYVLDGRTKIEEKYVIYSKIRDQRERNM